MKIGVIGLGSMGKRRLRLLSEFFPEITLIGVDSKKERQTEVANLFTIQTFDSLQEAVNKGQIDAVCVCTSPISHESLILEALKLDLHVFTEINLLNHYYEDAIQLAKEKNLHLYLSSTFLHRREIKLFEKAIEEDPKVTYRYHVGQYLPDWHPWESYKDFFVANKKTNGCREIFAIELPWLTKVFGEIDSFEVQKQKLSSLEIDYPDSYALIVTHRSGIVGALNVNILSRVAKRDLDIIGETTQISWDGSPDGLYQWDEAAKEMVKKDLYAGYMDNKSYSKTIIEDAYLEEIKEYVALLRGEITKTVYSFEQDKAVIELINQFEGDL
ncbi:Gfo/Idh/MocA family protein [Carnobacterium sp. TMP28]|uniref:Gfo/Idh/MocA family protein n=1 Tax=Carnobacterium sp. TMP28 TaxID=3397060 RepID=UPI0039DF84A2